MRIKGKTRPETMQNQANGSVRFAYDVVKNGKNDYTYSVLDVAGEPNRANIEHAFLLEHYSGEEIDRIKGVTSHSDDATDVLKTNTFEALKAEINGFINKELGYNFE